MVVFCSSSFQAGMFHNGKSFANTWEVKKITRLWKFLKLARFTRLLPRSSEKRPSSCQSCSPRSHIWKNRLRSCLCRMSHMIWWQCSLCKLLPSSVPCWTHSSGFFVFLFALVLAPVMWVPSPAGGASPRFHLYRRDDSKKWRDCLSKGAERFLCW